MSSPHHTRSWPEVVAFYRQLLDEHAQPFQPMLDLVEFLASPRYGRTLFPRPSHELLSIGRVPDFEAGHGELQVRFDGNAQQFRFTYIQGPDDTEPWSRECAADEWRRVLERLLHKRLDWFHEG